MGQGELYILAILSEKIALLGLLNPSEGNKKITDTVPILPPWDNLSPKKIAGRGNDAGQWLVIKVILNGGHTFGAF